MKSKSFGIMLVGFLLLGLMAIMIIFFIAGAHESFDGDITVTAGGVTEATLKVPSLKLVPGGKEEYGIGVKCEATGLYEIEISYHEKLDGGLKSFVNATVSLGDDQASAKTLAELIDGGEPLRFDWTFEEGEATPFVIRYEMPLEVGNEAKSTSASFDVKIKITKK